MRKILLASLLLFPVFLTSCSDDSSGPSDDGTRSFYRFMGGTSAYNSAAGVLVNSSGERVVAGTFEDTLRVTGSGGMMVAGSQKDIFLTAFEANGTLAWKRRLGSGAGGCFATGISRDANDNLYVIGNFFQEFSVGNDNFTGQGVYDVLVVKTNPTGTPLWAVAGVGPTTDIANDTAGAGDGGVYVCGEASSEITLAGEDLGEFGSQSGFLVKINANGVGGWAVTAYGAGAGACTGVTPSSNGTVIVCGNYRDSQADIGGEILPNDGGSDGFIARFTGTGDPVGNIRIGGTGNSLPYRVIQVSNEPIVVGDFNGTVDFDVTTAAGEVTSAGQWDAFVARYTEDGSLVWVKTFGTAGQESSSSAARTSGGDILLLGSFNGPLPMGSRTLQTVGGYDIFLARLDGAGNVRSAGSLGSVYSETGGEVVAAGEIPVFVGSAAGNVTFPDGSHGTAFGPSDAFIYQGQ